MSERDPNPDEELVRSLLRRSDGPVMVRPLRAPASRRAFSLGAFAALVLIVVVIGGVTGVALNTRRQEAAASASPSSAAIQPSPSGGGLGPAAGHGFIVYLGGHGIGIRTEADPAPYFQVTSRTLLSYAVSPDGKLAYWQTGPDDALPHELHVYDSATRSDRTVLTLTDERGGSSGFMVWSTDGTGIAFGTSDVGSAFEGRLAPARPQLATWWLLDLASGTRRKISTISDAWFMPVSWDRTTDIATATEYGRDGSGTPTRLFYVWDPKRAPGKASQKLLPALIDPWSIHADNAAQHAVGVEARPCAPSTCQIWTWPIVDPTAANARSLPGATLDAAVFRPGTGQLFALRSPLCCATPPSSQAPAIVDLGLLGSSDSRTVYSYAPGDANFFFRSDGSAIVVNNGALNSRRGDTLVDPAAGSTSVLPVGDIVNDIVAAIGPGPSKPTGPTGAAGRYPVRTPSEVLSGLANQPGYGPPADATYGEPLFVKALRPNDPDEWLVPVVRRGQVDTVIAVFIYDGMGMAGGANRWSGRFPHPLTPEEAAAKASTPSDAAANVQLVWAVVDPRQGGPASELFPFYAVTLRSGARWYLFQSGTPVEASRVDIAIR